MRTLSCDSSVVSQYVLVAFESDVECVDQHTDIDQAYDHADGEAVARRDEVRGGSLVH